MGAIERKGLTFLRVGGMASLEEAVRVLGDVEETRHRRCMAAKAIGLLGGSEYAGMLADWWKDMTVRGSCEWASMQALANKTPAGNVDELLLGARTDPDMMKYWDCAQSLARINSRRATRGLISIARHAQVAERRAAALHALWLLNDPRGTEVCLAVAANVAGEEERPRMIAVEALGVSIGRRHVQEAVARYLKDPLPYVKYSALCAAGRLYGRPLYPALRIALESTTHDSTSVYEEGDVAAFAQRILGWEVLA